MLLVSDTESGSESALSSHDDEDDEDDDAELELSELKPDGCCRSTLSAMAATSGRSFYTRKTNCKKGNVILKVM